jgi:DNA (cytosine-5)-methyltransferase 1
VKIGSLFSGIGGLELGLEWAGIGRAVWQVEVDEGCRAVLAKHWPDVDRSVTDVRAAGATTLGPVDLICGGFPCQDVSGAGKGAGKGAGLAGERSGLWFEFLRVVRERAPQWVVVENVASGKARWLCEVRSGLRDAGYRTAAVALSAFDVGAPHRRARIFVVGHSLRARREGAERTSEAAPRGVSAWSGREMAGGHGNGREWVSPNWLGTKVAYGDDADGCSGRRSQCGLGGVANGVPERVDVWPAGKGHQQHRGEPSRTVAPRDPGHRNRRPRLRALGNAVVPQCAEVIGRMIADVDSGRLPWEMVFEVSNG